MTMSDPIADMLTRIRNAGFNGGESVNMPHSKMKAAIAGVLKEEGYITDFSTTKNESNKETLEVQLKYYQGNHVISKIQRVSRSGLRVHKKSGDLPRVIGGLGIAIISTSQGVMSDRRARSEGLGGEVLCTVE